MAFKSNAVLIVCIFSLLSCNRNLAKTSQGSIKSQTEKLSEASIDQYSEMVANITSKLESIGYTVDKAEGPFLGENTKRALIQFQKDKGLKVGHLDAATLKALESL